MEKTCENCQKTFYCNPSRMRDRRFCCRECYAEWRSKNMSGENHPNWQNKKKKIICKECGSEFYDYKSKSGCCSKKCWDINKTEYGWKKSNCKECGVEFRYKKGKNRVALFCSKDCYNKHGREKIRCNYCGSIFEKHKYIKRKFCSFDCYLGSLEKIPETKECINCGDLFKKTSKESKKQWEKRRYCSKGCSKITVTGENHYGWVGGNSKKGRFTSEYIKWRMLVFKRDDYRCQGCNKKGGVLNAHHIKNYYKFEKTRECLENGITLCYNCHREFHSIYGIKNNNKKQVNQFLFNKINNSTYEAV